jgi:hypothetical protein
MPTSNDMEIISEQLDLLVDHHALAATERKKILDELNSLKEKPDQFKEYTESLSKGLPGVTKGVIDAIDAAKSGDPYAISIAAVDIFAGVVTMAGPLLGPFGSLASALAGMVSTILGLFLEKPPSLKEQLTELLNKFLAEAKLRKLGAALDKIWVLSDTIQYHSLNYEPLDLRGGKEISAIDDAWQWINQEDKQSVPEWDQVLEKTCMVWIQLLRCVTLSLAKPSTLPGVAKDKVLVYLPARQELFLKYLRSIKPVVQQRGLYLHLGLRNNGLVVYTAPGRAGDLKWSYKANTQWMRNISILVPRGQLGSPTPRYDLYACAENPIAIVRHQLDSVKGDLSDGRQLLVYGTKYPYREGGERWFGDCVSACALADPNDAKATKVYAVNHPASNHNYVSVHFVDSNNNVQTAHWEPGLNAEPQHIRAVAGDVKKSLPDDPDVAGLPPHGLYEIIYAAYRNNRNIWVALDNSFADLPGPENWSAYSGIEVDPYCLWIFGVDGIACATHASVVQCKNGKLKSPRWIYHDFDKSLWQSGQPPVVDSLYPCADETLVALLNTAIYTANYRIDRASNRIVTSSWLKRGGEGRQVIKMPVPCWPVFTQVTRDLEKQVKGHEESHRKGAGR